MNRPKQWLLSAYYVSTIAYRRHLLARMRQTGTVPIVVLFYHRIADTVSNDWTMSYDRFTRQIDWLADRFDLVTLSEAQRRIATGDVRRGAVAITFDDGYWDNCQQALPLLIRRRIPCTYFVSTHHVLQGEPFPHDVAAGHPLRVNTIDQLRSLAAAGVEIGAHTRTHCDLGKISDARQIEAEVAGSKRDLERALDRPIRFFAFPYGQPENLSAAALNVARQAG
ncbi:MAG: polysaccharide deacetylase family protein, partial [Pirellulales bacterium]